MAREKYTEENYYITKMICIQWHRITIVGEYGLITIVGKFITMLSRKLMLQYS